jgi:Cu+-exporting ATPase
MTVATLPPAPADATLARLVLPISGISCASCATRVEQALATSPGVASASVNLAAEQVAILYDAAATGPGALAAAIAKAGYSVPEERITLTVTGMTCAACAGRVERALAAVPGVTGAAVNAASGTALITAPRGAVSPARLAAAVTQAGYGVAESTGTAKRTRPDIALILCAALTLPFMADMAMHITGGHLLPSWVQLILACIVQAVGGARFYRGAWAATRARTGSMDQLVAIGTTAAFLLSLFHLASGGPLYFEASAVVITLVLAGKALEARAKRGTAAAIDALARLRPDTATRLDAAGREERVAAAALAVGDRVRVSPGNAFPADGVVEEGETEADESLITGESRPVPKGPGERVTAGAVNGAGVVVVRVTAAGDGTALARIMAAVQAAQASKAPVQAVVDRVAAVFVPAVLALSAATLGFWLLAGAGYEAAIVNAVSVLVIACPCALGLATPAALVAGTGAAARAGILIRDAGVLERARRLDTVVFDKTGTLTEGRPRVVAQAGGPDTLKIAAALQQGSAHPLARGILAAAAAEALPEAESVRALVGRGVEARIAGEAWAIGNARLMAEHGADIAPFAPFAEAQEREGATVVYLARGAAVTGALALADTPRPTAAEAIAAIRALGLSPRLLSGDSEPAARAAAARLGITEVEASVTPERKAEAIAALQAAGHKVAMVGDGVNDAPALARADLGIAIGGGTDAAMASADIALLRDDPLLVADSIVIALKTLAKVRQNLMLAFLFNVAALPLAAAGLLSPVIAGAAMAASSVTVVTNALALARFAPASRRG